MIFLIIENFVFWRHERTPPNFAFCPDAHLCRVNSTAADYSFMVCFCRAFARNVARRGSFQGGARCARARMAFVKRFDRPLRAVSCFGDNRISRDGLLFCRLEKFSRFFANREGRSLAGNRSVRAGARKNRAGRRNRQTPSPRSRSVDERTAAG